ncbi:GNAT family N-acetyltransferase [Paenibacillus sp. NEAU-GSW1]|uniref:GNAT family N-acetyltransferase n=1 Tax=Paenibacillus sp. NEAU-GSW1 TaxID=2682486 RepID=UPI0012E0FB6D|nr:GNAT family N-acetyltransferase [Paenibacillus sp. NEAU-GSW1]MUT65262.1 GNAT family N-acetyltransferase [Paenibacillus sp. NEAU-GSW1]
METSLRTATNEEIPLVYTIMIQSFEQYRGKLNPPSGAFSETIDSITDKISRSGGAVLALAEGQAVGSAQYYRIDDYIYLGRVAVLPSHRCKGIAKAMVEHIESLTLNAGLSETRLEVRLSIPDNVSYYKKLQYEVIEEHAYPAETDYWYVMSKKLR